MKLLLYGGTFDPPHKGHINNLTAAIAAVQPDYVVVMPAGIPPHKAASSTPAAYRMEMCRCFEHLHPHLVISDWEIRQGGRSYSIDTVNMLHNACPQAEIYLCIGSDMLLTFTEWRSWQQLLRRVTLVVQSRQRGDDEELAAAARQLECAGGHILFAGAPALEISSSAVRAGLVPWQQLPQEVQAVARQHHLYGR